MTDFLPSNNPVGNAQQAAADEWSSQSKLSAIFAQAAVGLSEISLDGHFLRVNDELCRILGRAHEEILTLNFPAVSHPDDVQETSRAFNHVVETGEAASVDKRCLRPNGEIVWTNSIVNRLVDEHGRPRLMFVVTVDLTEQKLAAEVLSRSKEKILQLQKFESLGKLAGGIAHDFNNMLTAINGYSDLTLRLLEDDSLLRDNIQEIRKAGERSASLTQQLLAFSRQQIMQPTVVDLNELIAETKNILQRLIGEDIVLITNFAAETAPVEVDSGQINQVVINLAVNARDAMPQGGKLSIETRIIPITEKFFIPLIDVEAGAYVLLKITDTGTGMDEETQMHIFEPFYTTKGIGKGTGLGMATVYGIVKQLKGYIRVDSKIGKGSTFNIYLPLAKEESSDKEFSPVEEKMAKGTGTILLVEDEEIVRTLTCRILEESGYQIIEAESGQNALSKCQSDDYKIDLLITDIVMPDMNGRQLAEKLKELYPHMDVLFTSGYMDDVIMRHGITERDVNFIQKPYSPVELVGKVQELLNV